MPACYVVDVGHGNATVVEHDGGCVVIDAGPGDTLNAFLGERGIGRIVALLLSHADADHIGGALALIARSNTDPAFVIDAIYLNPDPRQSDKFADLVYALNDLAMRRGVPTAVHTSLGWSAPEQPIRVGTAEVSVLAPSVTQRLHGVGYRPATGSRANANRLSAVSLISVDGQPWLLAPGDLDYLGFQELVASGLGIRAPVLVYPHHGGRAGSDAQCRALAAEMVAHVQPGTVIFSVRSADSRFPSQLTVGALLELDLPPALVCTGDSPVLTACLGSMTDHPHRNGAGTQLITLEASGVTVRALS